MKYKIGAVADQFGIHPQTIRYYEKEKLISSELGENSGTRYYIARDFKRMANVRRYLLMGFGTRDVRRLFLCETPEEINVEIRKKKQEVFLHLLELNRTLWALDQYEESLLLIRSLLDRWEITKRPEMYLFINQTGQKLDYSEEAHAQVRTWAQHLDVVSNASVVPLASFVEPDALHERQSGFLISAEAANHFGIPTNGPLVRHLSPERCLHTVLCLDGPAEDTHRLFGRLLHDLQEAGLRVAGDAIGRMLTVIKEGYDNTEHRPFATYYEYFIPVSSAAKHNKI